MGSRSVSEICRGRPPCLPESGRPQGVAPTLIRLLNQTEPLPNHERTSDTTLVSSFLPNQPGARQRHVDRGYRRRAGNAHRRRGPLSSHERRQCANEYTACQQHDVGHVKNSHGSAAEFDGRIWPMGLFRRYFSSLKASVFERPSRHVLHADAVVIAKNAADGWISRVDLRRSRPCRSSRRSCRGPGAPCRCHWPAPRH